MSDERAVAGGGRRPSKTRLGDAVAHLSLALEALLDEQDSGRSHEVACVWGAIERTRQALEDLGYDGTSDPRERKRP